MVGVRGSIPLVPTIPSGVAPVVAATFIRDLRKTRGERRRTALTGASHATRFARLFPYAVRRRLALWKPPGEQERFFRMATNRSVTEMKVRNSLKSLRSRHRDNRLVRRKGRVYIINKTQRKFKARQG